MPWVQAAKPTRQKTDVSKWSQVLMTCILFSNSCIDILAVELVVYNLTDSPGVVCVYLSGGIFYFSRCLSQDNVHEHEWGKVVEGLKLFCIKCLAFFIILYIWLSNLFSRFHFECFTVKKKNILTFFRGLVGGDNVIFGVTFAFFYSMMSFYFWLTWWTSAVYRNISIRFLNMLVCKHLPTNSLIFLWNENMFILGQFCKGPLACTVTLFGLLDPHFPFLISTLFMKLFLLYSRMCFYIVFGVFKILMAVLFHYSVQTTTKNPNLSGSCG